MWWYLTLGRLESVQRLSPSITTSFSLLQLHFIIYKSYELYKTAVVQTRYLHNVSCLHFPWIKSPLDAMKILLNRDESLARNEEAHSCYPTTPVQEYTFIQRGLESIPRLNKISQPCRLLLTTWALIATFCQPQDQNSAWRTINNAWNMLEHQRCPVAPLYQHFCYCYAWSSLQDMSAVLLSAGLHIYQALVHYMFKRLKGWDQGNLNKSYKYSLFPPPLHLYLCPI